MSALPASRALTAPITLPMSPGPVAPSSATMRLDLGGDLVGRQALRQVGLEHLDLGRFLVGQVGAAALLKAAIESLRCLISLSTMADHRGVVELDALVDFLLLHGGQQQADGAAGARRPWRAWRPSCLR